MSGVVMVIEGLVNGRSPFDGQYLAEYDPSRDGVDPEGNPMLAHIVATDDPAKAKVFSSTIEALECWKQVDPRTPVRPDGKPNRPLTAFTVSIQPAP